MSILNLDPIMGMQIWTVPQLKTAEDEEVFDDQEDDRDIPPDDYQEHINQEVKELNSK